MKTETPRDLFFDQLQDLFSVERQLRASLPTVARRADSEQLTALVMDHRNETEKHLDSVSRILTSHGYEPGGDPCKAMEGLIAGGDSHLDGVEVPATRDLMIIAHCLRIEHYEEAAYEITSTLAQQLGFGEEAGIENHSTAGT